jgi:hypothetical protein
LGTRHPTGRVDGDALHQSEVQHQAAFADRFTGEIVAAAAHRQQHIVIAGEIDAGHHIARGGALRNQCGVLVDHPVEDFPCGVVGGRPGCEQGSTQLLSETGDRRGIQHGASLTEFSWLF